MTEYNAENELLRDVDLAEPNKIWQHPWHLVHRVHLHEELKRRATAPEGEGVPVVLRTCSRVIDADPLSATAILENGERVQGDVLIGADGVHVSTTVLLRFIILFQYFTPRVTHETGLRPVGSVSSSRCPGKLTLLIVVQDSLQD